MSAVPNHTMVSGEFAISGPSSMELLESLKEAASAQVEEEEAKAQKSKTSNKGKRKLGRRNKQYTLFVEAPPPTQRMATNTEQSTTHQVSHAGPSTTTPTTIAANQAHQRVGGHREVVSNFRFYFMLARARHTTLCRWADGQLPEPINLRPIKPKYPGASMSLGPSFQGAAQMDAIDRNWAKQLPHAKTDRAVEYRPDSFFREATPHGVGCDTDERNNGWSTHVDAA